AIGQPGVARRTRLGGDGLQEGGDPAVGGGGGHGAALRLTGRDEARHCLAPARASGVNRRPVGTKPREASARPGGREAPAEGGAGAGRALEARPDKGKRGAVAKARAFAREGEAAGERSVGPEAL